MSELADEADSKSVDGNIVWVQVPLPALASADEITGIYNPAGKAGVGSRISPADTGHGRVFHGHRSIIESFLDISAF